MRSFILSALVVSSVGFSSVSAFAGADTVGTVGSFDRNARTFSIKGQQYQLPAGMARRGLSNGDRVSVRWEPQGELRLVQSFTVSDTAH